MHENNHGGPYHNNSPVYTPGWYVKAVVARVAKQTSRASSISAADPPNDLSCPDESNILK